MDTDARDTRTGEEAKEIASFPGEAVDSHLKMYGHLPELGCCEFDQPVTRNGFLQEAEAVINEQVDKELEIGNPEIEALREAAMDSFVRKPDVLKARHISPAVGNRHYRRTIAALHRKGKF